MQKAASLSRSSGSAARARPARDLLASRGFGERRGGEDAAFVSPIAAPNPVIGALSRAPIGVQAKLTIGAVDDPLEREADRVADQVMRMPDPTLSFSAAPPQVSRKCAVCEEEDKKKLQMKPGTAIANDSVTAPAAVHDVLQSPGQPLDSSTRAYFEPRFGRRLDDVRIHAGANAAASADAIGALAYTFSDHIAFAEGRYAPSAEEGRRLIAHELAHVIQQDAGRSQPSQIRRWSISNCTDPQLYDIEDAVQRAYGDLTDVLPLVQQRPVTDQLRNALWLAFRDDSDQTADLAVNNVARLQSQITSAQITCADQDSDPDCKTAFAHTAGIGSGPITICRPTFFGEDRSVDDQSTTIIHEGAHLYLSMEDRGYFRKGQHLCEESMRTRDADPADKDSGTAGDNPALRLENADAYACFVYFLKHLDPTALQSRSASYRGSNLTVAPIDDIDNTLYTQATTPQLHRFGVRGAPGASGFQYRWRLEAGSASYNPASMGQGSAGAFAEDNDAVYFPPGLTRLLEENNISQATLVCEIQLFGAYGDRFAPTVIRKSLDLRVVVGPPPFNL